MQAKGPQSVMSLLMKRDGFSNLERRVNSVFTIGLRLNALQAAIVVEAVMRLTSSPDVYALLMG